MGSQPANQPAGNLTQKNKTPKNTKKPKNPKNQKRTSLLNCFLFFKDRKIIFLDTEGSDVFGFFGFLGFLVFLGLVFFVFWGQISGWLVGWLAGLAGWLAWLADWLAGWPDWLVLERERERVKESPC